MVEYFQDLVDQGFLVQDVVAHDFCEDAYVMAGRCGERLVYEMEIVAR